ncbi:MAG: tetratricopeptide repeat protein [Terriglobales bacterium]
MPQDPKPADKHFEIGPSQAEGGAEVHKPAHIQAQAEAQDKAQARLQAEDHYYAALDHVGEGRDQQAVDEYHQALAADATFVDALHGLSRALQNLNRLDEAIAVANQLSALDPDDVLAHTSLSILYQKKGMIPEAEAEANKARILGWKQQLKGK